MIKMICFFSVVSMTWYTPNTNQIPYEQKKGYQLVWADEFDKPGLPDSTKWSYDVGGNGWGNNELQYYNKQRLKNSRVENGVLVIEARREVFKRREYTSARLVSRKNGEWQYGYMEIRAKLPGGLGTWPAIWMLPAQQQYGIWPASGEIDIMEHVGFEPGEIHGAVHTKKYNHVMKTQKTAGIFVPDALNAFHLYAVEWTHESIIFFVDAKEYFRFNNGNVGWETWPFDHPFYMILNIAIGGEWGGKNGVDDSGLPQKMEVDYVRVYEKK